MKFLADMGISPQVVEELRKTGHDALHLQDEGLHRLADGEILAHARNQGRVLLTHDLGFGELLAASGDQLPSVIIFRLSDMRPANVSRHLFTILKQQSEALTNGAVCSVTERKSRTRLLPI
jgi:predicted nuclease of predicted toxin-antitoxin system